MAIFTEQMTKQAVQEINQEGEKNRRAKAKKRHEIYTDGGRRFLIEQIKREFDDNAVKEMRLAPINLLKKIVNKKSTIYKTPPIRTTEQASDQALVDFYVEELDFDNTMQKAHRYYNLLANTALYLVPKPGLMEFKVIPNFLYSIIPCDADQTQVSAWCFNAFHEEGLVAPNETVGTPTGQQGFERERSYKTQSARDVVASNEKVTDYSRRNYIFWSDEMHVTTDENGNWLKLNPDADDSQYLNPFGISPVVNLAKDRDNEVWASQGEDAVDLAMAIALGWSDLLTIAKHQGFSLLTITSEEEPKKLNIGVNRAIWLKQTPDGPTPQIGYAQASSPLGEYKDLLMDLLGLLLTTNDMTPGSVSGNKSPESFTSGFARLIQMSDTLESIEADKPKLRDTEKEVWLRIGKMHNFMFDNDMLSDDAKSLGKYSDSFEVAIAYKDVKPIESEQERISTVKMLRDEKMITKFDAMKKLYPDLTDEQVQEKMDEIEEESQANMKKMEGVFGGGSPEPEDEVTEVEAEDGQTS